MSTQKSVRKRSQQLLHNCQHCPDVKWQMSRSKTCSLHPAECCSVRRNEVSWEYASKAESLPGICETLSSVMGTAKNYIKKRNSILPLAVVSESTALEKEARCERATHGMTPVM